LFLVGGLIVHKLVWEVLKRRNRPSQPPAMPSVSLQKRIVKLGKIGFLVFLMIQTIFLDILPISDNGFLVRIAGIAIYATGLLVAIVGRLQLGDNWVDLEDAQVLEGQSVVSKGIYSYIRHPIYTGDILLLIGLELAINSWLVLCILVLVPVVVRQASSEEALLMKMLPGYEAYRKRTKMFIPYIA